MSNFFGGLIVALQHKAGCCCGRRSWSTSLPRQSIPVSLSSCVSSLVLGNQTPTVRTSSAHCGVESTLKSTGSTGMQVPPTLQVPGVDHLHAALRQVEVL